ncbi:uncharacterized protein B0J16DRAFT_315388 [Fusarium flagelliforme]|uniref:Uncharacterized protein n=1 Tax=Fusarium flagelliforme TaxID=2675880 RepID=A0A395M5W3_9HYPO|nr:uncharacterized protein B0J16DRAFT_315388 [Fusarium flagelliforme]KAH7199114.1 hypothetical protein B0J16DRAFT_315388 [Fusarium flagelliforme]RFN43226.1 hypothetical protein FIE12Z_12536 [Fusarium flagelliforme]
MPGHSYDTMNMLLPTDPETPASDINRVLATWAAFDPDLYVHPKVLSFACGQRKTNYAGSLLDAADRCLVSKFIRAPKPNGNGRRGAKQCWLAFISCPYTGGTEDASNIEDTGEKKYDNSKGSWVGNPDWDKTPWHCSAAVVVRPPKPEKGYNLIICDPDPNPVAMQAKPRIKDVLRGLQQSLYKELDEKSKNNVRVWYRIEEDRNHEGHCLRHTMELLKQFVEIGGGEWEGDDDPRVEGCVQLRFK